jgi:hypothetical protein
LCTAAIAGVFVPESLYIMGWLEEADLHKSYKPEFWSFLAKLFLQNHCGAVFTLNGMGVGIGMALVTNRMRGEKKWLEFLEAQSKKSMSDLKEASQVALTLGRMVLPYSWRIFASLTATTLLGIALLARVGMPDCPASWNERLFGGLPARVADGGDSAQPGSDWARQAERERLRNWKRCAWGRGLGLLGDSSAKALAGYFGVVGIGFGIVLLRSGISFGARRRVG